MAVWAVLLAAVAAFATAGVGQAQALDGPREQPPAGFEGQQFVDSRGCVFLRAGRDGKPLWVQRLTRDRQPMCGYAPTVIGPGIETGREPGGETAAAAVAPDVADLAPRLAATGAGVAEVELMHSGALPPAEMAVDPLCPPEGPPPRLEPVADLPVEAAFTPPPGDLIASPPVPDGLKAAPAAKATKPAKVRENTRDKPRALPGGLYVQVGVYRVKANARGVLARLADLGLPAGQVRMGKCLRAVHAGPFASHEQAARALMAIRAAGFSDAYLRQIRSRNTAARPGGGT